MLKELAQWISPHLRKPSYLWAQLLSSIGLSIKAIDDLDKDTIPQLTTKTNKSIPYEEYLILYLIDFKSQSPIAFYQRKWEWSDEKVKSTYLMMLSHLSQSNDCEKHLFDDAITFVPVQWLWKALIWWCYHICPRALC